jgi:hypothetical protein
MAVLDDVIAQQLAQYPYAPQSPVRALLPQSQADVYSGGLRPADPTMTNVPSAEEEALQGSNILGDLAQRYTPAYSRFWFRPSVAPTVSNVLAQVVPLIAGMSMGGEEEGEGIAGALRDPARLTQRFFGEEELPYTQSEIAAFKRKLPESAHESYSVPAATRILPRTPENEAAYGAGVGIPEQPSRYHGARLEEPYRVLLPPEVASNPGNLLGKGFYTTDKVHVAGGYGRPVYNVYEINPRGLKFLNVQDEPLPQRVIDRVGELLPNSIPDRNSPSGVIAVKSRWQLQKGAFSRQNAYPVLTRFTDQSPLSNLIQEKIRQALEEEGYAGIRHTGGAITGGEPHDVKIYFNPGRDTRMRVIPTPREQWKSVYVRDKPIPGYPGRTGFRLGQQRVPAPIVAGPTGLPPGMDIHGNP